MKFKISFPVKDVYASRHYPLIITDADDVFHYWNNDGDYDGYSHDTCIDEETRTNKNQIMKTKNPQRTSVFPDEECIIYHNTFHKFSFLDRLRILFGRELSVCSKIETTFNASVTGNSEAKAHVTPLLVKKMKGLMYKSKTICPQTSTK